MSIVGAIKLTGLAALSGFFIYMGYLFYDKNLVASNILLICGIIMGLVIVFAELSFKNKRHQAPWQFNRYKGD